VVVCGGSTWVAGVDWRHAEEGRMMGQSRKSGGGVRKQAGRQPAAMVPEPGSLGYAGGPLAPIAHERVVELPRSEVWKLLATGEGWKRFFDVEARIELRPGGKFEILFDPDAPPGQQGSEGCTVLSFLPDEMLSFTWNAPPKFAHARSRYTWVVVRFTEPAVTRTFVRLDHLGFAEQAADNPDHRAEWEEVRAYFQRAWGMVLDKMKEQESKGAEEEVERRE